MWIFPSWFGTCVSRGRILFFFKKEGGFFAWRFHSYVLTGQLDKCRGELRQWRRRVWKCWTRKLMVVEDS